MLLSNSKPITYTFINVLTLKKVTGNFNQYIVSYETKSGQNTKCNQFDT